MRRLQRRKVLKILFLSLVVSGFTISSVLFSSVPSYADLLVNDASLVFYDQPSAVAGWIRSNPGLTANQFSYVGFSKSVQSSSSSYVWRMNWYFDYTPQTYPSFGNTPAQAIIAWDFGTDMAFQVDYIYQFRLNIRYGSINTEVLPSADFSKLYLCFFDTSDVFVTSSFSQSYVSDHFVGFAPSSFSYSPNSAYVEVVYNVPIYPTTLFPDLEILDSGTGVKFVEIPGMAVWDSGSGAVVPVPNGQTGNYRYSGSIFPRNTSSVKLFTSSEWESHVMQQGFDDLSEKIDLAAQQIVDAINPPVPTPDVDALVDSMQNEHDLIESIQSTMAYDPDDADELFDFWSTIDQTNSSIRDWMSYAYAHNELIAMSVSTFLSMAALYMLFRGVF